MYEYIKQNIDNTSKQKYYQKFQRICKVLSEWRHISGSRIGRLGILTKSILPELICTCNGTPNNIPGGRWFTSGERSQASSKCILKGEGMIRTTILKNITEDFLVSRPTLLGSHSH